ncbi:MAG: DEAD/DEAH box helicase [bacterium]
MVDVRRETNENHDESVIEPEIALPAVKLADLSELMRQSVAHQGWKELTPVQSHAIPYVLNKRDLMVQSRTGSGKTGAYVLPLLDRLRSDLFACQALVLVPTRELAVQVTKDAEEMCAPSGLRTIAVYGGVGYVPQLEAFKKGVQIVIGTPGRILDHLMRGTLKLDRLQVLIFDEADRLLSMGFYPDMREVKRYLPNSLANAYMFSATYPENVFNLARLFLETPEFLSLSQNQIHVAQTEHAFYFVPAMEKDRCLVRIIEIENPDSALIFCNTKASVGYVAEVLKRFGYDADLLSADLTQNARQRVMNRIKEKQLRFLVATDVAARGIDISALSHVIQYEPPEDPELYVHRAGRTGRAGAAGVAITLVSNIEQLELKRIAKRFNIEMVERQTPTDEDVSTIAAQRLINILESKLRDLDGVQQERMQRFLPLAQQLAEHDESRPLVAMLLEELYRQTLHAPPPQPEVEPPQQQQRQRSHTPRPKSGPHRRRR